MGKKSNNVPRSPFLAGVRFFDPDRIACLEACGGEFGDPIPVELSETVRSAEEATLDSVGSGLVKAIASGPEALGLEDEFSNCSAEEMEETAASYVRLLRSIYPDIEERLALAAMAKTEKGDLDFAEEVLLALRNISGSAKSYSDLALLYWKRAQARKGGSGKAYEEEIDKEVRSLHEGLKRHPNDSSLLLTLGSYHLGQGEGGIAIDCLQRALDHLEDGETRRSVAAAVDQLKSRMARENLLYKAFDEIMMDKGEAALATIREFLKTDSAAWEGWYIKGWALRVLDRCAEAREALLESVKRNPDIGASYNELALCERRLGNVGLAEEYLELAVDKEEDNEIYLANLAFLHLSRRDYDGARRYLDRARRINPDDNQVLDLIDEYEALTGEKLGAAVVEESLPRAEVEKLRSDGGLEEI